MTTYVSILAIAAIPVLFFTSKTEWSRVVTIQRPIVITQERKTPAFYVFQQIQRLQQKNPTPKTTATKYLSSLSLFTPEVRVQIAEMKLDKREISSTWDKNYYAVGVGVHKAAKMANAAHEAVIVRNSQTDNLRQGGRSYERVFNTNSGIMTPPPTVLTKKWATIRGKFELIGGVGIIDHYIEIKRVEEGQVRELGRIDLAAGLYSIDIESPRGHLIAQIKDRNGALIGEDREGLINLQSRGHFYEGPFLQVGQPETLATNVDFPTGRGATAVVSLFDNQKILEKPDAVFENISRNSSTISRVFDPTKTYKNITSIRQTGDKTKTPMFTTKWTDGVISYASDVQKTDKEMAAKLVAKLKSGPIIIGQILLDGKPVSNATVEIDGVGISPIYFDQFMIPSLAAKGTSQNGYFMFVGVGSGTYQVVAFKKDWALGSQMFIAEEEAVAFQNISSLSIPKTKVLRTFDAFSSEPVAADIVTPEAFGALETSPEGTFFKTFSEQSLSEYLVRTSTISTNDGNYIPIRYVQSSRQDYVHVPLIHEKWLEAIKNIAQQQLTAQQQLKETTGAVPNTGIIIGFTKDLEYDAYLVSEGYNKNNIVYFNSLGEPTPAPTQGGGFVLYNVPIGAREVVLQERSTEKIYSQVFNVLESQVSVAHFVAD